MQSEKREDFEQIDGRAGRGLNGRWRNRTRLHEGRRSLSSFESEAG